MAIYNSQDGFNSLVMPPQQISLSKKLEKDRLWGKKCMDVLEQVAMSQIQSNYKLIENYEMVKGHFIPTHYFGEEGYASMLQQLSAEFELPHYLRHYDIISPVVNTLSGEHQKRPDLLRVKAWDEFSKNEYLTKKTNLIKQYISSLIDKQVTEELLKQGIDESTMVFESEEQRQQFEDFKAQTKQALTPPEIENYMQTEYRTAAEIWAEGMLELDEQRFNLKEKEKVEFEDMCIADRCFRHFYLTPMGYEQETWNPVNVFFHKSPEVVEIENGDYVGRQFYATPSDIIDRYGHKMTKKQIEMLEKHLEKEDRRWNEAPGYDYVYKNYMFPFKGYQGYDIVKTSMGAANTDTSPYGIPFIDNSYLNNLGSSFYSDRLGMFLVTEGYWMSQKKMGYYTFIDEETGILSSKLVDENVILPDSVVEIHEPTNTEKDVNTVCWTYVNEVWQGTKINIHNADLTDKHNTNAIYLDLKPLEFQFKGDINPYNAKLPVCGQIFSVRNSRSMSLVDLMKPYQIGFNVAMNQVYQLMEKEIGAFIVFDVNMFPDSKDWGGEDAWEKWMLVAKNLGMLPADTSPSNTKGAAAAAGGQFPKILNLDLAAQMMSRINLAQIFKKFALEQIGFNDYRLGNFAQSSTATGIEEGQQRSFAQTETYFTNFYNYLRRCKRMNLDIAQYTQAKNKDITLNYVKSDLKDVFIKISGTDLMTADLHLYVANSQEHIRQLESLRALGMQNTTQMSEDNLAELITTNSPSYIKQKLKMAVEKREAMQAKQMEQQQAQTEAMLQVEEMKQNREDDRLNKKLESEERLKQMELELQYNTKIPNVDNSDDIKRDSNDIKRQAEANKAEYDRTKLISDREQKEKELALKNKKIDTDLLIQQKELESVKVLKGKKDN
ncbi:hypothetical protein [Leptolyngbya phage Lbo-JY46]